MANKFNGFDLFKQFQKFKIIPEGKEFNFFAYFKGRLEDELGVKDFNCYEKHKTSVEEAIRSKVSVTAKNIMAKEHNDENITVWEKRKFDCEKNEQALRIQLKAIKDKYPHKEAELKLLEIEVTIINDLRLKVINKNNEDKKTFFEKMFTKIKNDAFDGIKKPLDDAGCTINWLGTSYDEEYNISPTGETSLEGDQYKVIAWDSE